MLAYSALIPQTPGLVRLGRLLMEDSDWIKAGLCEI